MGSYVLHFTFLKAFYDYLLTEANSVFKLYKRAKQKDCVRNSEGIVTFIEQSHTQQSQRIMNDTRVMVRIPGSKPC